MESGKWIAMACAVAMSLCSCAKIESEDTTGLERAAFDAWMQTHVLDRGVNAVKQANGIYVEFLSDGNQSIESSRDTLVWLRMDYTSRDIEGNTFATRDSLEALRQRTFSPHTHYNPEYVYVARTSYGMIAGRHWALENNLVKPDGSTVKMSEGSRVRLYIPASLAYGSSGYTNDQGYGGQFKLDGTRVVIEDLTVREVVKNPLSWEEEAVVDFARQRWGLGDLDTIATCFFVDTINFRPLPALLEKFPNKAFQERYALTADSTARIWYVGRFMDGFIFDTNISSVYDEFYNRRKNEAYPATAKSLSVLSYTPTSNRESYIQAFYQAIPDLRRGQWSRIVFTSAYGYGSTGMSKAVKSQQEYQQAIYDYYSQASMYNNMYGNNYYNQYAYNYSNYQSNSSSSEDTSIMTEIQPYTPLIFEIYIETNDKDE